MQLELGSSKNSKKCIDLKKIVQQGPQTHRPHCTDSSLTTLKTDENRSHDHNQSIRSKKSNKTVKSTGLLTQLKELNIKRGSQKNMFMPMRNKENQLPQKNKSTKVITASLTISNNNSTSQPLQLTSSKHLKINSSSQISKKLKIPTTTTQNKDYKWIRFEQPAVKPSSMKNKSALRALNHFKKVQPTIKDFQLGRKLGKGRFGNVYLAQEKQSRFALAIKIINIKQLKQAQMQDQLVEQIKLQVYCNHPNILKMYGCIRDQTNIYLLLQLGTGCLFKSLRLKKMYSEDQTAYYIKQVVEALKYLHSENIIHRDIKPENILIVEGVLKLSDFGWSTYSPVNQRQTFCGTLDYVPPEIVKGDFYDQTVDIWSLGVLCYELATGRAPFEVPNDQERTYGRILSVELNFPSHISKELKDLISRILVKDPKERLSLNQIDSHIWLTKHNKTGRCISKEVWESWEAINH